MCFSWRRVWLATIREVDRRFEIQQHSCGFNQREGVRSRDRDRASVLQSLVVVEILLS